MIQPFRLFALSLALVLASLTLASPAARAQARPSQPPTAVVLVVNGTTYFMGNDTYVRASDCRQAKPGELCRVARSVPGAHAALAAALGDRRRGLGATLGRKDRLGMVVFGDTKLAITRPGPAIKLTRKQLGSQKTYAGRSNANLAGALAAALELLSAQKTPRRAVIAISAGLVSDGPKLAATKAAYVAAGVPIIYLQLNPTPALLLEDPVEAEGLRSLLGGGDDGSAARRLDRIDQLGDALREAVDALDAVDGAGPRQP